VVLLTQSPDMADCCFVRDVIVQATISVDYVYYTGM